MGGIDYAEAVDLGGGQLAIGCSEFLRMGEDQGMAEVYDLDGDDDGDGELTIFDFLAFGAAFDAGCA